MPTLERIDSPSPTVRAIERWKRGLAVAIITALGCAPGILAAVGVALGAQAFGADSWSYVAALVAFLIVAPWSLGQRYLVRQIGKLAEVADD